MLLCKSNIFNRSQKYTKGWDKMDKRKMVSLGLACTIAFGTPILAKADNMKDTRVNWAQSGLDHASKYGILKGDASGVRPNDTLTRGELAAISVRILGLDKSVDLSEFKDIKETDWNYDYMSKAVAAGIFKGSNGKLNPNTPITREETFVVMSRMMALSRDYSKSIDTFKDSRDISIWAEEGINAMLEQGFVNGDEAKKSKS